MASPTTSTRGGWLGKYIPIWAWLPAYQRSWLGLDVIAGLTVWVLVIPEAVAYAQIAGVPPQVVLAAAPVALLAYAFFGTSRQVVVGSTSSIAILTAAIIAPMAAGGSERYIALAADLAILVGALFVLSSLLRLGFASAFLSRSVITGFLFGLALVIAIGQVGKLFGIKTGSGSGDFFMEFWNFITHLGETNGWTLLIGVLSLVILFGLPRVFPRIPAALVALIFGILFVSLFNMEQYGVAIVGTIPGGFPQLKIPAIGLSDLLALLPGALGLTLVAYSEHTGATSASATRHHYDPDANQELIAVGIANLGAGLFQGFAVGGSLSRSTANDVAGARSQISSLVASSLVLLTAIALTPLFYNLPEATLGAIVIRAVISLMNVGELQRFYRLRTAAFVQALTAMLGVLTLGVLAGLLIAVALSLLILIYQASQPAIAVLGKVPGKQAYGDIEQYPENETIPGLLLLRPDVQFYFANNTQFRNWVRDLLSKTDSSPMALLIDLQATARLDIDSLEMLTNLQTEMKAEGIELLLASVRAPVRDTNAFARFREASLSDGSFVSLIRPHFTLFSKGVEMTPHIASWNDTPTKQAIVDFVAQVSNESSPNYVPPEARIAVFDNDGTLWCEKPMPIQADFILRRLAAMADQDLVLRERQPWKAAYEKDYAWLNGVIVKHYHGDESDVKVLLGGVLKAFEGITIEAFEQQSGVFLRNEKHPTLHRPYLACGYKPMVELLRYLEAHGFTNYIASGGGRDFIRPITQEVYGIPPERVIGSTVSLSYREHGDGGDLIHKAEADVLDDGPAKPVRIWSRIGRRPILAGGNSNGDIPMLQFARQELRTALRLLPLHDDPVREFDYVAGAEKSLEIAQEYGWTMVSIKNDWRQVFEA